MYVLRRVCLALVFYSALAAGDANHIRSGDYAGREQRLAALKKYLRMHSPVHDAIFDLYDVNFGATSSIPGPTHRDYRIAFPMAKTDLVKWLNGVVVTSFPQDAAWCHALLAQTTSFAVRHKSDFWTYTGKNKTAFYFEKDHVLCLRIYQD